MDSVYVRVCCSQPRAMCVCVCLSIPTHTYTYTRVSGCTCICHQGLLSFEARQTLSVSAAAALPGFAVPPIFAAGWRSDGIFHKAEEMACSQSAGAKFYPCVLIHEFFFPFLALECQRESGCFGGVVPAESVVTRQPQAIAINWNNFHLLCNCNNSQVVSWFEFRGFPLSLFLLSALPTRPLAQVFCNLCLA